MKTNQLKAAGVLVLACLTTSQSAFAQASGSHGGDPNELAEFTGINGQHLDSWYSIKQDLLLGMTNGRYKTLELYGLDKDVFAKKCIDTIQKTKLQFDDLPISVNGVSRPCENFVDNAGTPRIHCNAKNYSNSIVLLDADTQYKLIGHEYISLAGFEPNSYGSSDYRISSQISKGLISFKVKRWAVHPNSNDPVLIPIAVSNVPNQAFSIESLREVAFSCLQSDFDRRGIIQEFTQEYSSGTRKFKVYIDGLPNPGFTAAPGTYFTWKSKDKFTLTLTPNIAKRQAYLADLDENNYSAFRFDALNDFTQPIRLNITSDCDPHLNSTP